MEDYMKQKASSSCPKLLDLMITKENEQIDPRSKTFDVQEEKKLELKLGPPGVEEPSALSLGYFPRSSKTTKRGFSETVQVKSEDCPSSLHDAVPVNAAGVNRNSSKGRTNKAPVVGWPPVRSTFRKNIACSSSKPAGVEPQSENTEKKSELTTKTSFYVKINMDGIPIGRKVDLKAYANYEKLSAAVEELFQGLLAAQKEPSSSGANIGANIDDEQKQAFTGLLDGNGEYTLVYEDNEGDRMLVGDVPWEMFVSTAKRLRVLKSSELSKISLGADAKKRFTVKH